MNTTTDIKLAPASQPTAPYAHPVKLWASGGCTGYTEKFKILTAAYTKLCP